MRTQQNAKYGAMPIGNSPIIKVNDFKNRYFPILLMLGFILILNNPLLSQFSLGTKINYTSSTVLDKHSTLEGVDMENAWKPSIGFGLIAKYSFSENISLKTEFLFLKKGSTKSVVNEDLQITGDASLTMKYFEIPILAELNIPFHRFRIYADLGPSFSFWRNGCESGQIKFCNTLYEFDRILKFKNDGKYVNNNHVKYLKGSEYNRFDILLNAGLGFSIESNGGLQLFMESRISKGLLSYYKVEADEGSDFERKHLNINFSLGFTQRLGI